MDTIFKVFWYDSTRGMNFRPTDCETDALTTTPSYMSQLAIGALCTCLSEDLSGAIYVYNQVFVAKKSQKL